MSATAARKPRCGAGHGNVNRGPKRLRMEPRSWKGLALSVLVATSALAIVAAPASAEPIVEIMVLGETHGTESVTRSLVEVARSKGATGCVCPGDFTYGDWDATPGGWRSMMQPLMGNMMPAQGNHDWPWSDWSSMFPGGAHYYEKDVGGAHFIALNTEYSLAPGSKQRVWLESNLAERGASALKVVFMHRPWWLPSGAHHDSAEFESKNGASAASMSALMEKHGVDLVVSAHEKNYQHSLVGGVHYLVAGGGGPSFYSIGYSLPGAVKRLASNAVSTLEISSTGMTIKSYDRYGNKIEEFAMGGSASSPAPSPSPAPTSVSFAPRVGSEWWVQVGVGGSVAGVDARDTGGAWVPLAKKSWGDWAASFRVEAGHDVQYRARTTDGQLVESCWYDHPRVACATATTTPTGSFAASFRNVRGNEWWVETDVTASGGTLAGVDARVNGGAWTPLDLKSWGSWAKSLRAATGSTVELRARSATGDASAVHATAWPPP
jgi:Calcineurin-like phosphoesterase